MYTLQEIAELLGLEFSGDGERRLRAIAPLAEAAADQLAFISGPKFLPQLRDSAAGAVILSPDWRDACPGDYLLSDNPYLSYARASQLFDNRPPAASGVHASAVVAPDAQVGEGASVGPGACIESGAVIGDGAQIGAGVFVGAGSRIGARSRISANTTIYHDVHLGSDCLVHSQTALGSDGFGFAPGPDGWEKICQLGGVRIGDRVEIGAGCTVDRGALGHTVIEDGVIMDNQVHLAHNCRIGKNTAIAGCVGIAGSTTIGANCTFAGQVGVGGHLVICDNAHFTGQARVNSSVSEPGIYSSGTPLSSEATWKRNAIRFTQLEALNKRVAALEKEQKTSKG